MLLLVISGNVTCWEVGTWSTVFRFWKWQKEVNITHLWYIASILLCSVGKRRPFNDAEQTGVSCVSQAK